MTEIHFQENSGTIENVIAHFNSCDAEFVKILNSRIPVSEYAAKIVDRALRFEAWMGINLIGLVAAYYNDEIAKGFITNVSVVSEFQHCGIGSQLLMRCIDLMQAKKVTHIELEVNKSNLSAKFLYMRFGFEVKYSEHSTIYMIRHVTTRL